MENKNLVKIENNFVFKEHYNMPAIEQKVMLCLITKVNPRDEKFFEQFVTVKELQQMLNISGKKWGSFYARINELSKRLFDSGVEIPSDILGDTPTRRRFFEAIEPKRDKEGQRGLKFIFARWMETHLLNLEQYVNFRLSEVIPMKSTSSIRIYMLLKAHRNQNRKYKTVSHVPYTIKELQSLLSLEDKYSSADGASNFKKKVIDKAVKEINEYSNSIEVGYVGLKEGRRLVGFEFSVFDVLSEVSNGELERLSVAKRQAYELLVAFGVKEAIALKSILPTITGERVEGFEDIYVERLIVYIRQNARLKNAGTLVTWLLRKKDGRERDFLLRIEEEVYTHQKKMRQDEPLKYENRMMAKNMTEEEFKRVAKRKVSTTSTQ